MIAEIFNAALLIIKRTEQCKSLYENCMVKAKTLLLSCDRGSLHVNVEEK